MNTKQAEFQFIYENEGRAPIRTIIGMTSVSVSGYYKWRNRDGVYQKDLEDEEDYETLKSVFDYHGKRLGRRGMADQLSYDKGIKMSPTKIRRLMRKYNLFSKVRQKKVYKRYDKPHETAPNVLNRNFKAEKPMWKLAIDISYIRVFENARPYLYLCAVRDLYNGEIVAYTLSKDLRQTFVTETLNQLKEKGVAKGATLHSDQGTQFTTPIYFECLEAMGIYPSMSRRGNCWDNACIESFFSQLKTEALLFNPMKTEQEVRQAIDYYMYYYNNERVFSKLKLPPAIYRQRYS